ncbi:MAG: 5-formyltetrahydrofolate cyclo-ligase [Novosphingobium sp.]|nr:5-formyltetrahydrofolate cyclo-ligase [Novosphingobium sp.]
MEKERLREEMRQRRRDHVASLPTSTSALLFMRPPAAIAKLAPEGGCVGLYHAKGAEAPTAAYAGWLYENGRTLALPWFADPDAAMTFRSWSNPWDEDELESGPFGALQPRQDCPEMSPALVLVPLLAFTEDGERLGQGGGHYDRWLAVNPQVTAIGLAWDCQLVDALPTELHDCKLRAIVTPTRQFEGAQ